MYTFIPKGTFLLKQQNGDSILTAGKQNWFHLADLFLLIYILNTTHWQEQNTTGKDMYKFAWIRLDLAWGGTLHPSRVEQWSEVGFSTSWMIHECSCMPKVNTFLRATKQPENSEHSLFPILSLIKHSKHKMVLFITLPRFSYLFVLLSMSYCLLLNC